MKKVLFILLICSSFILSGCNKKNSDNIKNESIENEAKIIETDSESSSETNQSSFDESENYFATEDEDNLKTSNGYEIVKLDETIIKYVMTDDGSNLNYREEPVDGEIIFHLAYGNKLELKKRTAETFTIGDLTDYWYYIYCYDLEGPPAMGWVFGGFLSDKDPNSLQLTKEKINTQDLIGSWENDGVIVRIFNNGDFSFVWKERGGYKGKWSILDDGTLYITEALVGLDSDEEEQTRNIKIRVCNSNRLVLHEDFMDGDPTHVWTYDLKRKIDE